MSETKRRIKAIEKQLDMDDDGKVIITHFSQEKGETDAEYKARFEAERKKLGVRFILIWRFQ